MPATAEAALPPRERSLFIATPMFNAQCGGNFELSMFSLARDLQALGIRFAHMTMNNESHITRARNSIADTFLSSTFSHLLCIDSDIGFCTEYVLQLLALAEGDKHIVAGSYPRKEINWARVRAAALAGIPADDLPFFACDFVMNLLDSDPIDIEQPRELREVGCGFMMIQRSAMEVLSRSHPELFYTPDTGCKLFDGKHRIMSYFNGGIDGETDRYLSDDYFFCDLARKAGLKIWLCPWMELTHQGTYVFKGSLKRLAEIHTVRSAADDGAAIRMWELPRQDYGPQ